MWNFGVDILGNNYELCKNIVRQVAAINDFKDRNQNPILR